MMSGMQTLSAKPRVPPESFKQWFIPHCQGRTDCVTFELDSAILWFLDRHLMTVNAEPTQLVPLQGATKFGYVGLAEVQRSSEPFLTYGVVTFPVPYVFDYEGAPEPLAIDAFEEERALGDDLRLVSLKQQPEPVLPRNLTTGYDALLTEIHKSNIWSWRDLERILGPSHTELQRIAKGKTVGPQTGSKIDALHQFVRALLSVTRRNEIAIMRALSATSDRDGNSAIEHLQAGRFREAFAAVMDAVSPRASLPEVQIIPPRWSDRPSHDIHENGREDRAD